MLIGSQESRMRAAMAIRSVRLQKPAYLGRLHLCGSSLCFNRNHEGWPWRYTVPQLPSKGQLATQLSGIHDESTICLQDIGQDVEKSEVWVQETACLGS